MNRTTAMDYPPMEEDEDGILSMSSSNDKKLSRDSADRRGNDSKKNETDDTKNVIGGKDTDNTEKDKDEAFWSLLSSQRQLLNKFSMEKKPSSSSSSSRRRPNAQQHQSQLELEIELRRRQQLVHQQHLHRQHQQQHSFLPQQMIGHHQSQHPASMQMDFGVPPNMLQMHQAAAFPQSFFSQRMVEEQKLHHYQHVQNLLKMQQQQQQQQLPSDNQPTFQYQHQSQNQDLQKTSDMASMSIPRTTTELQQDMMRPLGETKQYEHGESSFGIHSGAHLHLEHQQHPASDITSLAASGSVGDVGMVQSDLFSLTNHSIDDHLPHPHNEKRQSIDLLRRLSMGLGLGDDEMIVDDLRTMRGGDLANKGVDLGAVRCGKDEKPSSMMFDPRPLPMMKAACNVKDKHKRRRSSLSLLSDTANLFEYEPEEMERRLSIAVSNSDQTHSSPESIDEKKEKKKDKKNKKSMDQQGKEKARKEEHEESNEKEGKLRVNVRLDPSIDIQALKGKIETFASSMDKSAKTQQDIHDWDRKMGLKRSHSKTMRLSMRSRKKLRSTMKREMSTIYSILARKNSLAATATASATDKEE